MDEEKEFSPIADLENEIEVNIISICLEDEHIPYRIELLENQIAGIYLGAGGRSFTGYARLWCQNEDRDFALSLLEEIRNSATDAELPIAEGDELDWQDEDFDPAAQGDDEPLEDDAPEDDVTDEHLL